MWCQQAPEGPYRKEWPRNPWVKMRDPRAFRGATQRAGPALTAGTRVSTILPKAAWGRFYGPGVAPCVHEERCRWTMGNSVVCHA